MARAGDKGTTIHRKANGTAYLYAVKSYWDKEKKQARNKQVCLGRLNEETGELIESTRKRKTEQRDDALPEAVAQTKVYGPYALLMKLANDMGLTAALKKSFPNTYEEILSLAFFVAQKGLPLSRCDIWSMSHQHPFEKPINSQRVSELLQHMSENERQHFLSLWLKRLSESEILCYDVTSISSYATSNEYIRWGYNRDKEKLPQINLAMLYGQESGLPAYYRRTPGNITDVITLENTIETLDFLGKTKLNFILDRGFYSETNVDALLNKRYHFTLMVPSERIWVRNIIDQYYETIASPEHYRQTSDDEVLYMISHLHQWGERRCYAHLYYNATRAAEDFDKLNKKLLLCKEELEAEKPQEINHDFYERFFIIKRTPIRGLSVKYNEAEIQKYRKRYAGFFCILTNVKVDSSELLKGYRRKSIVENSFDDLKNSLDMKRLRVHSSVTMDSRLFIQFIALILISKVRSVASEAKQNKQMRFLTVREIMEAMECIVRITYSGIYDYTISKLAPLQRDIVDAFGLELYYLCSPDNPTGSVYNSEQLAAWIAYAIENDAVILYDAAYEIFVQTADLPTSIYQIDGAKKCAIEFCSLSKTAGFTGTRCGYTVVPHELVRNGVALNKLWLRRQTTKFNGVSYIVQRGAAAVFTEDGYTQIKACIAYYLNNARVIADTLDELGIWYTGGLNSPYIWLKCPNGMTSWEYFDFLLAEANVVGTPGVGFGRNGEGFLRLSAFGNADDVLEATARIKNRS